MRKTTAPMHGLRSLIKLCLAPPPASLARLAPLIIRLIVGYGFMAHGLAKLFRGADSFAAVLQAMGLPLPHLLSWITIGIEIFGGLAILLGAFVTLASIPMIIVLLVAIFTVHLPYGFSSIKLLAVTPAGAQFGPPGYETDLLYVAGLVALVIGGPGYMAIDTKLRGYIKSWSPK
jgi:putative oxidoreductase